MKIILIIVSKKFFVWGKWIVLGPKMVHPHNSRSAVRFFWNFAEWKEERYMKILWVVFEEKFDLEQFDLFRPFFTVWLDMVKFSQATVTYYWILSQDMISFMITTGCLNSPDMIRILKQSRHDFSGKHLCDGYCMDIMWCLCGGQNSWFCKASLRICYVSLFECKGPWMLKTDSLIF